MMTPISRTLPALVFCVLIPPAGTAQHFPANDELIARARALVEKGSTGVVIAVLDADGSTRVVASGEGGPGARPLGARSLFEIGSITKTFTTTVLTAMAATGEVSLSDPISKHLPSVVKTPSRGGREITLLDLATHHSGLPRLPDNFTPPDMSNPYATFTVERLYSFVSNHTLTRDIGAHYEYSNVGFGLLGHVLARVAGKPYEEVIRDRLLRPLGMTMTTTAPAGEHAAWMTKGHNAQGSVVPHWDVAEGAAGAGGFRSNAEDMLKFLAANVGLADSPLERAMRVTHQKQRELGPESAVGLAWLLRTVRGRTIVLHGGGTAGFRTMIGFDADRRVGLLLLTNSTDSLNDGMFFDLLAPAGRLP